MSVYFRLKSQHSPIWIPIVIGLDTVILVGAEVVITVEGESRTAIFGRWKGEVMTSFHCFDLC
jgi:hypothetical protein